MRPLNAPEMQSGREECFKSTRHLQFLRVLSCHLFIAVADPPAVAYGTYIAYSRHHMRTTAAGKSERGAGLYVGLHLNAKDQLSLGK